MIGSERADMERGRGAIEADIGDELAGERLFVQSRDIGALMNESARQKSAEKFGFRLVCGHIGLGFRRGLDF